MKYCLSSHQPSEILREADEIYVQASDWRMIPDLYLEYPKATVILDANAGSFNAKNILSLAEGGKLICCLDEDFSNYTWFIDNKISFYFKRPVTTFYDLRALLAMGVRYVVVGAPLTFQMEELQKTGGHFRMSPNAGDQIYPLIQDGLYGQWVRPEDIVHYEGAIETFQFKGVLLKQEATLFDIYKNDENWPGNLRAIFNDFYIDVDNRSVLGDIGLKRANCGQRCQASGKCRFCHTATYYLQTITRMSESNPLC